MKLWWLSWWDPPKGKPGKDVDGIKVWISGTREVDDVSQDSCVALVIAPTESVAWAKVERYYPGATAAEQRFSEEHPIGWRPGERFPLDDADERMITAAEAS